jgi:hypothetical protein
MEVLLPKAKVNTEQPIQTAGTEWCGGMLVVNGASIRKGVCGLSDEDV